MSHFYSNPLRISGLVLAALAALPGVAQVPASGSATQGGSANAKTVLPPASKQASSPKAAAYYHFSLGHLYEEMAGAYGNRSEYVNKAIDNFRLAMKEDPSAGFLVEDIAELYRVSGRLREAVEEAQTALKANPNDLNARRVLARIYTQQIGDAQTNHVDENMARKAVEQYKQITDHDPKDVDSLVMQGRLEKLLGSSVDAEAAFKKAIAAEPDSEDALTGLASVYSDRGDSRKASELLEKLAQKDPSARALTALASNYEQMKEYGLAAEALRKAVAIEPTRPELKQYLAQDLALSNHLEDALKVYQDMADSSQQDAKPYLQMSRIYREQGKFDLARQMLDKQKALEPDDLEVRYDEAMLFDTEGKSTEAIATLKSVLDGTAKKSYSPSEGAFRTKLLEQLGLFYRKADQTEQAVDIFRQIAILNPDSAARAQAQVIDTYRMAKDYSKANQEADQAAKKYPTDRVIRTVHAQLLADQGKADQAIAELKKSLDGKNDRETYISMAEVYETSHNYAEMAKALDQAEKLSPEKDDKVAVYFMRGAMYERQKNFDLAEKQFRRVLEVDPTNTQALNYLGYMFADQGVRLQEAQDLIKRAVSLEPNNGAFLDSLGWVYFRLNRLDDAAQQLQHSIRVMGTDPTIHDHLGDVYFKQGKIKEAIDQWQTSLKAYNSGGAADVEPDDVAKVQKKLDGARVRLAKEQGPNQNN